jgi:hypothetical protein
MLDRVDPSNQLASKERLNSDLSLMGKKISQIMESSQNSWLLDLRMPAVKMMKRELKYAEKTVSVVTSFECSFIFDMKTLLDKMNTEEIKDEEWNDLIHDIRVGHSPQKIKTWPRGYRDFIFRCAIRHGLDLLFKEHTPIPDELNVAIEKITEVESLDYQDVHNLLSSLCYIADSTITLEFIQKFSPAIALLKEKNLLSKINFLRLFLCCYPNEHDIGQENADRLSYQEYNSPFYQRSLAPPETTVAFIELLAKHNILTQKNLELVFKLISWLAIYRNDDNTFELLLKGFTNICVEEKVDNHNDRFETFLTNWYRDRIKFNAQESLIVDVVDSDPVALARNFAIGSYLNTVKVQLTERLEIACDTVEEKKEESSLIQYCAQLTTKREDIDNIFQYMQSLTKMISSMLRDNIHTDFNLQLLIRFANKSEPIFSAYELLRETKTFATPQETFDILIETVEFSDSIAQMILWLWPVLRTPKLINLILHNASYVPDLLEVCRYEFNCFGFRNPEKGEANRIEVAEMLIMRNMTDKMEYLSALRKIYDFAALHRVSDKAHVYMTMQHRLKFVKSIAANLEAGSKENMTRDEATKLYNHAESAASEEAVSISRKWVRTLYEINQCNFVRYNLLQRPKIEPALIKGCAGYILDKNDIYYVNKLRNEFKRFPITDSQYLRFNSWFININISHERDFLIKSECEEVTKIIGHAHEIIPVGVFESLTYLFSADHTQVLQGCLLLYSQLLLTEQWGALLKKYPEYAVTLAKALIKLKQNELLKPEYTDLLSVRPELALSIAVVLSGYAQTNSLTTENFDLLKNNLRSAIGLAKMFEPEHNEQNARIMDEPQRLLLLSGGTDNTQLIKAAREEKIEPPRTNPVRLAIKPGTNNAKDAKESQETRQDMPLHTETQTPAEEQEVEFAEEVVVRCLNHYNRNALFSRSKFLKMAVDKTPTLATIQSYVIENPRSRTAEQYMHLQVERMSVGNLKSFMTEYLKDYQFKWYQRSQLVDKFFAGKIKSLDDVKQHGFGDMTSRTNKLINKYRL